MGLIRKKTATKGSGGLKYICDVCSADITSTVRIHCADDKCSDYDLCVPCFSKGESSRDHEPAIHAYNVVEQHSIPIYTEEWGADEELLMLEGCEIYGLGSWADIADHIGGFRDKEEVRNHYIDTYVRSPNFPLPALADAGDRTLIEKIPREEFQARKKRRIEERKEAQKNAPPLQPKPKPTASVPSCHEVQGFMPGRLEFETEFANEAEEAVQHMQFEPGEGFNPRTGELEPEMELKMVIMDIYNSKLTMRTTRKRQIFEHNLLEYRKNAQIDKKRTKDERELFNKVKPYVKLLNHKEWSEMAQGIEHEHHLRQAIIQLREWRANKIGDLKSGEKYETEKAQRAATRSTGVGSLDRMPGIRPTKAAPAPETPAATIALTAAELPERLKSELLRPPPSALKREANGKVKQPLANGNGNTATPDKEKGPPRKDFQPPAMHGVAPLKLTPQESHDMHLLSSEEKELCSTLRLMPKAYLALKEGILREAIKNGGSLKKKDTKLLVKLDTRKSNALFDFFVHAGWIMKA